MSKKNDEAFDKFLADVLTTIPDDTRRAMVEEALKGESTRTKVREGVLARSEFSRQMDEVKSAREALTTQIAEANERIQGWTDWYGSATREFATMQDRIKQYEDAYGALDADTKRTLRRQPDQEFVTVEDFRTAMDRALQERDAQAIGIADMLTDIKIDHSQRFKEKLDSRALLDFATKNQMRLDVAYERFVADKVEAQRQADMDAKIKQAREEGAREALSRHNLPVVPGTSTPHPIDEWGKVGKTQNDRVRAAVEAFNSSKSP